MDQATIDRYQPGGDIYHAILVKWGVNNAHAVANAALTGDRAQVASALASARGDGPPLDGSTADAFIEQIETDPLAAPLASANSLIGNSFVSLLKNPFVLVAAGGIAFFALGGADVLRKLIKKI